MDTNNSAISPKLRQKKFDIVSVNRLKNEIITNT